MLNIVLIDTLNHPTPILLEWSYGLEDLGYNTKFIPNNISILSITEQPDILIYASLPDTDFMITNFEIFKKKFPKCKIIASTDVWKPNYIKYKDIVDFFFTLHHEAPTLKNLCNKNGFELYSIPLAANHRFFYKKSIEKKYDACFIGTLSHGYRSEDKFLYPILDNYKCFLGGMIYKNYQKGFVPYKEHNDIRNMTKINLNFHVPYQKPNQGPPFERVDLNQSVFNIALSGNFQLCDHPYVTKMFDGSVVLGDENNWLELFKYYLNNNNEREELAEKARIIAEKNHTWKSRMIYFMNILDQHYKK